MAALATQMRHFGTLAQTVGAREDLGDAAYKALVVVFLAGGNDANNLIIPNHSDATLSSYDVYNTLRGPQGLAIPQNTLLPITVPVMNGLTYGLHPSFGTVAGGVNEGLYPLWAQQKMAIVTNCGTLVRPTTKAQYQTPSHPKPYQLFSHSDQVAQSQTAVSNAQSFTGWGGRVADRMTTPGPLLPMITSISGAQLFTAGQSTLPLAIANAGTPLNVVLAPTGYNGSATSNARLSAFNQLRTIDIVGANYVKEASHVTDLAMQANLALQSFQEVTVTFPGTNIGNQLKQVARLIKKRNDLSATRQIFYCQLGGFDTHANQLVGQANLISQFSQAARAFYDEMVAQGTENSVTLFTMSDFGRTFNPAGSGAGVGSDHAWGSHMFVVGGSVMGGNFYGMPTTNGKPYVNFVLGGPDDTDTGTGPRGRWIPTTSVDQYAATLARWYGLLNADQSVVFPNIGNFPTSNLGFMP